MQQAFHLNIIVALSWHTTVSGMEEKLIVAAQMRGTVLFVAGRFKVEYPFNLGHRREITVKQNSHFERSDLDNLCRLVRRGMVRLAP